MKMLRILMIPLLLHLMGLVLDLDLKKTFLPGRLTCVVPGRQTGGAVPAHCVASHSILGQLTAACEGRLNLRAYGTPTKVGGMSDVWVELRVPRFVMHRHSVALHCDHNVDSESIYKVVFYKDGRHFTRYIRNRDPPYEIFNITGAEINIAKVTSNSVTLEKLDFSASGSYACEIALETPLYSKVSRIQELSVFVRQKHRPKVKLEKTRFTPNDFLDAICHSAPAHPAPHLTWFINNAKVDEKLTIPHGTAPSKAHHHGMLLSTTSSSLHFPLPALGPPRNQTVDITCFSTIPSYATLGNGYADAQNTTIAVDIFRLEPAPTQLPVMIASAENASSRPRAAHLLTVFMYFLYRNV